eukprot:550902-Rhodomonas_salina.1
MRTDGVRIETDEGQFGTEEGENGAAVFDRVARAEKLYLGRKQAFKAMGEVGAALKKGDLEAAMSHMNDAEKALREVGLEPMEDAKVVEMRGKVSNMEEGSRQLQTLWTVVAEAEKALEEGGLEDAKSSVKRAWEIVKQAVPSDGSLLGAHASLEPKLKALEAKIEAAARKTEARRSGGLCPIPLCPFTAVCSAVSGPFLSYHATPTNLSYGAMPGEFLGLVQAAVRTNQFEEALENLERAREAYSAVGASDMDPVLDEEMPGTDVANGPDIASGTDESERPIQQGRIPRQIAHLEQGMKREKKRSDADVALTSAAADMASVLSTMETRIADAEETVHRYPTTQIKASYEKSGTDIAYDARCLLVCYDMSVTDIA